MAFRENLSFYRYPESSYAYKPFALPPHELLSNELAHGAAVEYLVLRSTRVRLRSTEPVLLRCLIRAPTRSSPFKRPCCRAHERVVRLLATSNRLQAVYQVQ